MKKNVFNQNRLIICDSNLIEFVLIEIIKDDRNELLMWHFLDWTKNEFKTLLSLDPWLQDQKKFKSFSISFFFFLRGNFFQVNHQ
jgi:hypothetical protein